MDRAALAARRRGVFGVSSESIRRPQAGPAQRREGGKRGDEDAEALAPLTVPIASVAERNVRKRTLCSAPAAALKHITFIINTLDGANTLVLLKESRGSRHQNKLHRKDLRQRQQIELYWYITGAFSHA